MIVLDKKILIIDDQPEITEIISEIILSKYPDLYIKECNSPNEAISLANSHLYDLIITDYHMPEKSGIDVLKEIRAGQGPNKRTSFIFITATKDEVDRELGDEFGNIAVFDKVEQITNIIEMIESSIS
jgi:CheY-like chemotaxis protein